MGWLKLPVLGAVGLTVVAVMSGCLSWGSQAPVIVNNTSDNGTTVLLAVVVLGLVGVLIIAAGLAVWGCIQYRRRQDAETVTRSLLSERGVRVGSIIDGVVVRPELLPSVTMSTEVGSR